MKTLEQYIKERKARDKEFAKSFDKGYKKFKLSFELRMLRLKHGITQEQIARKMHTKKSAISRMENKAEDVKLSTLYKYAAALGKRLNISIE